MAHLQQRRLQLTLLYVLLFAGFMEVVRAELALVENNKVKTTTVYPYFINTSALYVDHWKLRWVISMFNF